MANWAMLRRAKVVAVHPGGHAVDLKFTDDGSEVPHVEVMTIGGSSDTGLIDLPTPTAPAGDPYSPISTNDRDIYAVVGRLAGVWVVLGFMLPQISQMTFTDTNRRVHRHASDVYSSIDDAGNFELAFPNGTYLRVAAAPAHEDLTGKDFDKKWAIKRNTGAATHLQITLANAGAVKASFNVDPSGNITVTHAGALSWTAQSTAYVKASTITFDTPTAHFTGNLTADGTITGTTDVVAAGISGKGHHHGGVQTGSGVSGVPQ